MSARGTTPLRAVAEAPEMQQVEGGIFISDEQLRRINPDPKQARRDLRMLIADLREPKRRRGPVERPRSVRMAQPGEEEAVYELVYMAYRENGFMFALIDPPKVKRLIHWGTHRERGMLLGVIERDGVIVATCSLAPEQFGWSQQWHLQDHWQYVHPDHRQSHHVDALLDFECWCADEMSRGFGYPVYVVAGVLSTHRTRAKERVFQRHMNHVGASFIYPWPLGEDE